jgi:hypothetical protein
MQMLARQPTNRPAPRPALNPVAAELSDGRCVPSWQGHWMAAVRLSHKRVFLGEGIMIEVILARSNDPAQVGHLSPQGPGGDTGR